MTAPYLLRDDFMRVGLNGAHQAAYHDAGSAFRPERARAGPVLCARRKEIGMRFVVWWYRGSRRHMVPPRI